MYRVIIIDDELLMRVALKSIIDWEKYGLEIVGEFENGKLALQEYEKLKPHIVLTDIKMPVCNGIELIKELKERDPNVKCIILSAYNEFELVKEGMRLGAEDYLLKLDISPEKLIKILQETISKIDRLQDESIFYQTQQWNNSCKKFLIQWIRGEYTDNNIIKKHLAFYKVMLPEGSLVCLYTHLSLPDSYINSDENNTCNTVINLLDGVLKSYGTWVNISLSVASYCSVGSLHNEFHKEKNYIENIIRNIRTSFCSIMNVTDLRIETGISDGFQHVPMTFKTIQNRWIELNKERQDKYFEKDLLCLENAFNTGNFKGVLDTMESISQKISDSIQYNRDEYDRMCSIIIFLIISAMERNSILDSLLQHEMDEQKKNLELCQSASDYIRWFAGTKRILNTALEKYINTSNTILKAKQYIEKNYYKKDFKLEQLADYLLLSPSYVSKIFSREVGCSVMEYLMQVRIDHAREMMVKTQKRVNEIAREVGYDDAQYFSKVFKRVTGCSPMQFKKNSI
ncbi:MAG: response regulator transcription factor [Acetivibrionales bacterium]